jgi:outer membrane protein assembly factor BamB
VSRAPARRALVVALLAVAAVSCTNAERNATSSRPRFSASPASAPWAHPAPARWSAPLPHWPFAITADDDGAFVLAGDGDLLALDPESGRERWRAMAVRVFLYPPAVDRDTVVLSARDRFVAFERTSGKLRWEVPVTEEASAAALAGAGNEAIALLTTEAGTVTAVDARSGRTRWSVHHPGSVFAPPAVDPGTGIAAVTWHDSDVPRLRALEFATGAVRWEAPIGASSSAAVISDGVVVTGEGDARFSSRIVGRDVATGAERWAAAAPASFEPSLIPGASGDGEVVAIADHFGTVTLLDARRGTPHWQVPLDEPVLQTRMHVTASSVILTTYGGNLVVLDRATGRLTEREYPGGYPAGTALADRTLLVALRLTEPGRVEARPAP